VNTTLDTFQYSADLVKRWGQVSLPNGKTLRETLVVDGIALWDVAAPVLAAFYFPKDLARKKPLSYFSRKIRPCLSRGKRQLRALIPFPHSSNGCSRWPGDKTCLLLGFSGYMYRDVLESVARCLKENHAMNYVALHDAGRFQGTAVKLHGEEVHSVWEHWDSRVHERELAIRRQLSVAVCYLTALKTLPDLLLDADGKPLWPKVENTIKLLLHVHLPSLMPYLALTRHILEEHRPVLIVSPDISDPRIRLFVLTGRLMGIPSLEVQSGLLHAKDSVEWQFNVAEKVAVWGERVRYLFADFGISEERIIITGSPRFDGMINVDRTQVDATRSRLGIPDGRLMVLFASQYLLSNYSEFGEFPSAQRAVKRAIFEAADRLSGMTLVVKPHPLENVQETKKIAEGCKNIVFVKRSENIRELTKACDVFITLGSTATMDALVARKLIIFPAFPGLVWWDDVYLKGNVVKVATSKDELERSLQSVVKGHGEQLLDELEPARQRFLKEWVHLPDGRAAERIATLAKQMAGIFC